MVAGPRKMPDPTVAYADLRALRYKLPPQSVAKLVVYLVSAPRRPVPPVAQVDAKELVAPKGPVSVLPFVVDEKAKTLDSQFPIPPFGKRLPPRPQPVPCLVHLQKRIRDPYGQVAISLPLAVLLAKAGVAPKL